MSKKFLSRMIASLVIVLAAVLWLLSELEVKGFGFFNLAWAGVLISASLGVLILLEALMEKNNVTAKNMKIWVAVTLIIVAFICLISAIAIPSNIVVPVIAIICAAGLPLSLLATGGKKWDEGDNQRVGYKDYHQRKKEEEKK